MLLYRCSSFGLVNVLLPSYDLDSVIARLAKSDGPAQRTAEGGAGVAVILREGKAGEAEVLLIGRAERAGDPWSGHMAFPGGRYQSDDVTLLRTAVRETFEEVGLDLDTHARVLTELPGVQAMVKGRFVDLWVVPFVFVLAREYGEELSLNEEVAAAMWTAIGPLARREVATTFEYRHEQVSYRLPGFRVGERTVWGLTYRMLESMFERLGAE